MRTIPWLLAILAVVAIAWIVRDARHRIEAINAEVAAMEVERDSLLARVAADSARADSVAAVADSIQTHQARERAEVEARARRLAARGDSLAAQIIGMVPEGAIRDSVAVALGAYAATFEARIADIEEVLRLADGQIEALRRQNEDRSMEAAGLREALAVTTAQRDAALAAHDPGLWQRLKDVAAPAAVVGLACLVLGLVAG